MKKNLPFVFINFAVTADGKIAFANHKFVSFGSRHDREHMMELRAIADAVMCGAKTIEVTGTILGNGGEKFRKRRLKRALTEFPLRVIVSGSGSINPTANIFKKRFSPIVILTTARISKVDLQKLQAVADEIKICGQHKVNLRTALAWLRKKWNVKRLLCEGGGALSGALVRAGLVDELHLTISPRIFGGRTAPTIADGKGFLNLTGSARFKLQSAQRIGDELFAIFTATKSGTIG